MTDVDQWHEQIVEATKAYQQAETRRFSGDFDGAHVAIVAAIKAGNLALDSSKIPLRCRQSSQLLRVLISFSDGLRTARR